KAAPQGLEAVVEPARRCTELPTEGERAVEIADIDKAARDPPERGVSGGVVFGILAHIPPRKRRSEIEQLRRLAGIARCSAAPGIVGARRLEHPGFGAAPRGRERPLPRRPAPA